MTLTPHSIIHGDAYFAYFNKIWGIPLFALSRTLFLFLTDCFAAHLIPPLPHDPSERFLSRCRLGLSAVERDLSQFEALKKAVLAEAEGRKPCRESFLAHSRRAFCVQHRRARFLITPASRLFRPL